MVYTGLLLFLIGTYLPYSYTAVIRNERSLHPCENHKLRIPVEDVPCSHKQTDYEEPHFVLAEIPSAPSLPTIELSKSPIVVLDSTDDSDDCQSGINSRNDIEEAVVPCPSETSAEVEEETVIIKNLPTPPELPPLVSFNVEEDCKDSNPTVSEISRVNDIREETAPCPYEESSEDVKETIILPNLPTPPELPPVVSFNVENDCDNIIEESISPAQEHVHEIPSRSYDEEDVPCSQEEVIEDIKETVVLPNLPTAPELPPLVSYVKEEDCENNLDESISSAPYRAEAPELPSQSFDIQEESTPCEESHEDVKETIILPNLPTPPELPPLVSYGEEENCDNVLEESIPSAPAPVEVPSRSFELLEETAPCVQEESVEVEEEITSSFKEEEGCDQDEEVKPLKSIPPPPELPTIALPKLPLDIVLPKEESVVAVPLPKDCVRDIVVERVMPNIVCRKANSSNKANRIPNPPCDNIHY